MYIPSVFYWWQVYKLESSFPPSFCHHESKIECHDVRESAIFSLVRYFVREYQTDSAIIRTGKQGERKCQHK